MMTSANLPRSLGISGVFTCSKREKQSILGAPLSDGAMTKIVHIPDAVAGSPCAMAKKPCKSLDRRFSDVVHASCLNKTTQAVGDA
jgi:hypothetical protein